MIKSKLRETGRRSGELHVYLPPESDLCMKAPKAEHERYDTMRERHETINDKNAHDEHNNAAWMRGRNMPRINFLHLRLCASLLCAANDTLNQIIIC